MHIQTLSWPFSVRKPDNDLVIQAGDTMTLRTCGPAPDVNNQYIDVTVFNVQNGGRKISWDRHAANENVRAQDIQALATEHFPAVCP